MKLKEKLAKEYQELETRKKGASGNYEFVHSGELKKAWLAGFEKAKKLLKETAGPNLIGEEE